MNEKRDELVTKGIEKLFDILKKTGDFVMAEVPDVLNQLLIYDLTVSLLWTVLPIVIILIITKYANKYYNYFIINAEEYSNVEGAYLTIWLTYTLITIGFIGVFLVNLHISLKILLSPKVYLLEYGMNFFK